MSLFVTLFAVITFFLPGLAVVAAGNKFGNASTGAIFSPLISSVIFGFAGLIGWMFPELFGVISWLTIVVLSAVSLFFLLRKAGRTFIRQIDPIIPLAYLSVVLVATQMAFLPIKIPDKFPASLEFAYFVREDVLPVRIQSLHHNLPNDNILPFRFAQFILRGVDFTKPREEPYGDYPSIAPGQAVTARTPLMALIGAQYLKFFVPDIQVDGTYGRLGAFLADQSYHRFFIVACILNALLILPAYLFAQKIAGQTVARITLLLLALNYSIILETNFIWPKAFAGYFALLFAYIVLTDRTKIALSAILAAMAYYTHQSAMGIVVGAAILFIWNGKPLTATVLKLFSITAITAVLISPWTLWSKYGVGFTGNLISQNFFQNSDSGWWPIVAIRISNIIKSLIPHPLTQADAITSGNLFATAFFTLPGSIGLLASVFFLAAITFKNAGRMICCLGIVPILITAVMFGQSHGGLMPFGPFLFVPFAMAFTVWSLFEVRKSWRVIFIFFICLEQAAVLWFSAIQPQWSKFAEHSVTDWVRLVGIYVVLTGLSISSIVLAKSKQKESLVS